MTEFMFINPSPNMELVANAIHHMGRTVKNVYTKDFLQTKPDTLWAFIGGSVIKLGENGIPGDAGNDLCMIKKPFFAKFRFRYLKERLTAIHPNLSAGSFQDYVLLSSRFRDRENIPVTLSDMSFEQITERNSGMVITSIYPSPSGRFSASRWRTDYDINEAMGRDYFFFFDGKNRHELYCHRHELVYISDAKHKLDWLKEINPTLKRFTFEKTGSISFHQNQYPWIQKYSSRVFLLNDYSWQGVSVLMPDSWAVSAAKFICNDKKNK